jgi:hypothetical protein
LEHPEALNGGRLVGASAAFQDVDPSTGRLIALVAARDEREIDQAAGGAPDSEEE